MPHRISSVMHSFFIALLVSVFLISCSGGSSDSDSDDIASREASRVSPDGIWTIVDEPELPADYSPPTDFTATTLDWKLLQDKLDQAPDEFGRVPSASVEISMPMPDGSFNFVAIARTQMMESDLVYMFPTLQTYRFDSVRPPNIAGHITGDMQKLYATGQSVDGLLRIDPLMTDEGILFISYYDRNRTDRLNDFVHVLDEQTEPTIPPVPRSALRVLQTLTIDTASRGVVAAKESTGGTLRTFRFTATTTGEFYQANDTGNGNIDVILSLLQRINAVNAVFEVEVGVRLILAANTLTVLFNDPNTDGLNDGDTPCNLRDANRTLAKAVLNDGDYDLGFLFSTGTSGGCAWYVVCQTVPDALHKARGAGHFGANGLGMGTGLILHESGHQLGAKHTYSGQAIGCNLANFDGDDQDGLPSAYAPGSGSTIMSYSGSCGSDNVDLNLIGSGQYFYAMSFEQIVENITSGTGSVCGGSINTGNDVPTVMAGADYTIPQDTPFTLTGSGNDAQALIFTWEQIDLVTTQRAIDTDPGNDGPIIRSVPPVSSPSRTIPDIRDLLVNLDRKGEFLPETDRPINFRLSARDMQAGGGGVNSDDMLVTVSGDPFFIMSPNFGNLSAGCVAPVTWEIGGGNVAQDVDISYSATGGLSGSQQSFPQSIVQGTPNDGDYEMLVPCGDTLAGRIKVMASDNIFFDVNNNDLTVTNDPPVATVDPIDNGEVDDQCEFTVFFSGQVTDSCGINAADVEVILNQIAPGDNFLLGTPAVNIAQNGPTQVDVSGSVLVSDLMVSPAMLEVGVKGTDNCGTANTDFKNVEIADTTPPEIDVSVSPDTLWPPNHKMRLIQAVVTVTDNCPGTTFVLHDITSDEPDNGQGDGNTVNDIQNAAFGTADLEFDLRSERAGGGDGRTYTVTYSAADIGDNTTDDSATVNVPHNQ